MSRIPGLLATLMIVSTVGASALPSATNAGDFAMLPVKCNANDVTVDGRVFPEPRLSQTFLTLSDFECGVFLLENQRRSLVEVTTLGDSASGHPIYDILLTDEGIPAADKRHLFVMNSIHGNEPAGREGAARVIEDMVDPKFLGAQAWVRETLDKFVVHFVFSNPDGWVNGDAFGRNRAGLSYTRANNSATGSPARDLNRNFPIVGYLRASNGTSDTPEGRGVRDLLLRHADQSDSDSPSYRGWYLGTDNHGQGAKPVAASGLQIVGEFDYEKSERLAHFADGINGAMAEYDVLDTLEQLNQATGGAVKPYEWGTLYDILGYSASGSGIDYYNSPTSVNGTGFATEMTAANGTFNVATHPGLVNQLWVDSTRAINYTMFKDAINPPSFTYPVGGKVAYIHDPALVLNDDANGMGTGNVTVPSSFTGDKDPATFSPYSVTRMKFFEDLNKYASAPLDSLSMGEVLQDPAILSGYDSVVLSDNPMPEPGSREAWAAALRTFAQGGGNLVVLDGAAPIIDDLFDDIAATDVTMTRSNVGYVDFGAATHHLNENLRGVASQTYDVIPIGFPDGGGQAPNWRLRQAAWDAAAGSTAGTTGTGQTSYGERPLGAGKVSFLGALLPQPSEDHFHPYGLQNYAVTYTGYTLLENMLDYTRPQG